MKASISLVVALVSASSFAVEVPALPPSEFADTEVSTNFAFAVGEGSNRRLVFSLELAASPTNNVKVAIGSDAVSAFPAKTSLSSSSNPASG